ncbi:MAG TPA: carbon-nitrogen hydrolase family protein [Candidatus Cybelea sp.]|nr:carbon-nitrogen hydrolase family protein [Candidatus Cybelea sp.]
MVDSFSVAALQLQAHDHDAFTESVDSILEATRRAAADSDLVVLPEATFPAYVLGDRSIDDAAVNEAIARVREIAERSRTVIVVGAAAHADGALRNAALVIDADGSLAGRADKLFLWHFDRRWFTAGEHIEPIPTAIGALGVLICADGRLPTIARELVDRGAQALIMPTAWVTSGRDPDALENVQADLLARVRAYENGVPFVAANKCGAELGMVAYCGKSQVIDARGEVIAIASQRDPQTLRASVAAGAPRPHRAAAASPSPRDAVMRSVRLAVSFEPLPGNIDQRLRMLDDEYALAPDDGARLAALDLDVPTVAASDELVLDPAGLVGYRRAGYALVVWTTGIGPPWCERLARARALELRCYVVVFDESARRAFAVDPDGAVVAGTFDGFRLASFGFDGRKTSETSVAPATDVREGLERTARIVEHARG